MTSLNWIVSLVGSRQHYAVPRAFHLDGRLHTFYADAWCGHGAAMLRRGPAAFRRLAGRRHPDLPSDKVVAFTAASMLKRARMARPETLEDEHRGFLEFGAWFDERVRRGIEARPLDPETDAFFGFYTASLETLRFLRERKVLTIVDQAHPARTEEDLVRLEMERWPGWERVAGRCPEAYYAHLEAEWAAADIVLVNSEWSRTALVGQGVPREKIIVVPIAFEVADGRDAGTLARRRPTGPITVLWLGSVILRKGIPYLVEAARALEDADVRFVLAGRIGISADAVASAPSNMEFLGPVTRDRAQDVYRKADVFVLPTISDGFAITQLEAMANGLPVITTPNCGDVVTDGVDGLLVPAGDAAALAAAIGRLDGDRDLVHAMSRAAIEKSRQFSVRQYAERVRTGVATVLGNR